MLSPVDAASLVREVDSLAVPLGPGVPGAFLHALGARDDFRDLQVAGALLPDLFEVFTRPGVTYRSGFFGPAERFLISSGIDVEFVPCDFRGFIGLLRQQAPRIVSTIATPPDSDGWMSLSLHAGAHVDELRRAASDPDRVCLIETSDKFPRTRGVGDLHRHAVHVDEVDVIVEGDYAPIDLADAPTSATDRAIAEHALAFVRDGATLQTGIGGVPNALAGLLADRPGGGYGIHSEMFTSGLMRLHLAGKVTNDRKGLYDGYSVTTFAAGTPELYSWLDGNEEVRFLPVDIVNAPDVIARNRDMVTINGALAVDLSGQVVADTIDGRQFSGIGGHEDFVAAAGQNTNDRSLVCLPSTVTTQDESVSRITARLASGAIVTTPRHQVDVVVTEFGAAELRGLTVRERASALVRISHPHFRDELQVAAEAIGR